MTFFLKTGSMRNRKHGLVISNSSQKEGNRKILKTYLNIKFLSLQVFRIKPPMCITKDDVDYSVAVLRQSIFDHANNVE